MSATPTCASRQRTFALIMSDSETTLSFAAPNRCSLSGDPIAARWSAISAIRMEFQSNSYSFPRKGVPFQGASPYANPYAAADTG